LAAEAGLARAAAFLVQRALISIDEQVIAFAAALDAFQL